jgi:molybdopterin synthase sulfur carrier subunit
LISAAPLRAVLRGSMSWRRLRPPHALAAPSILMPVSAATTVTVRALLFAGYADALGREVVMVTVPAPATVGSVVAHLRALPGGDRLPPRPLCAVNLAHARFDLGVTEGDEVAILPPLAGG